MVKPSWNAVFGDVPTLAPFEAPVMKDFQHVLSELWTDHERGDHFSLYLIRK